MYNRFLGGRNFEKDAERLITELSGNTATTKFFVPANTYQDATNYYLEGAGVVLPNAATKDGGGEFMIPDYFTGNRILVEAIAEPGSGGNNGVVYGGLTTSYAAIGSQVGLASNYMASDALTSNYHQVICSAIFTSTAALDIHKFAYSRLGGHVLDTFNQSIYLVGFRITLIGTEIISLTIQDGSHTHITGSITLAQHNVLTVQDGSHTHKSYIDYLGKILNTQSADLIGAWALDEAAGASTVNDYSPENNDGTPSNVTFEQAGIGDGRTSASFNGTTSGINAFSAGLAADFNGDEGTFALWAKVSGAGVWTDGIFRRFVCIKVDDNNYIIVLRHSTDNVVYFEREGGGVGANNFPLDIGGPLGWFYLVNTWNTSTNQIKTYFNGTQIGAVGGCAAWSGTITQADIGHQSGDQKWSGLLAHAALWTKVLTDAEILSLWRVGLVQHNTLAVQNGSHIHTSSDIALAQHNILTVQAGNHTHSGDNVALAQHNAITVQSGSHTHSADGATLTQHHVLVVQAGSHTHSSSAVSLAQHNILAVQAGSHTHSADNVILGMAGVLVVQNGSHTHTADTPALAQHNILAVQAGNHTHTAGSVILTQHNVLAVQVGSHTHSADAPVLTYHAPGAGLAIQNGSHTHSASVPALAQHNALMVQTGSHTQTSDNVILAQLFVLIVASGMHTQAASSPVLVYHAPGGVYQTTGMERGMSRGIEREMI